MPGMTADLSNMLSTDDMEKLVAMRHRLHQTPELSGEEKRTAQAIADALMLLKPDDLVTGLGGHGVAAVFDSGRTGPTILFRAELDGLPIPEISDLPHRSQESGKGHMCGHDGHMTILLGLAGLLSRARPTRGRIIVLFQPAEENGRGAEAIIADPAFARIRPDLAFAIHNMPSLPFGFAALKEGPVNCASRGMRIAFAGTTAHASSPDNGISPVPALVELSGTLSALSGGSFPEADFRLVTVTHLCAGAPSFGVAPGTGEIWATLRTLLDSEMSALVQDAERLVHEVAARNRLQVSISHDDVFAHCENHPAAVAILKAALEAEGMDHGSEGLPMRASEDFGRFGKTGIPSAMVLLGAGVNRPDLHNPDYDFPDPLIPIGVRLLHRTARLVLG